MSETPAPIAESRRFLGLDAVRGLAVLGILAVNACYFAAPMQAVSNPFLSPLAVGPDGLWSWSVMHVFFELKMVTLFSILFGVSLYLAGGETDDEARGKVLLRRLAWMALFGIVHGVLIWFGDILLTYAVTGLGVMFVRSWAPGRLLLNGLLIFAIVVVLPALLSPLVPLGPEDIRAQAAYWAPRPDYVTDTIAAYQGNGARANVSTWLFLTFHPSSIIFIARTAALMMIGMALFKWGFFNGRWPAWRYGLLTGAGAASLALVAQQAQLNVAARFDVAHMTQIGQAANHVLSPLIALAYASVIILLVKWGALIWAMRPLCAVGRMAFSNYIAQSLIMTSIFYGGRGFGLYGEMDRQTLWLIVLGVWALQLIWSPLWLSRFNMGPLEWVWRRLSYARPVAIAKWRRAA